MLNIFKRAAILAAAAGLLVLGELSPAAAAHATTVITATTAATTVTNCSTSDQLLAVGFVPDCTSSGTVSYPTSLTLTVSSPQLPVLLNVDGQGIADQWAVTCDEGGGFSFTDNGTFSVNAASTSTTLVLPIGGSVPHSCAVTSEVQTIDGLSAGLPRLPPFTVQQAVTAAIAVPGVIRTSGSTSVLCADDTSNLSVNANPVQAYSCLGDLADFWVLDSYGEFVHDGLCMTENLAGVVVLGTCAQSHEQEFTQTRSGGEVTLTAEPSMCLTATSTANGTPLRVRACTGAAGQLWMVPGPSA